MANGRETARSAGHCYGGTHVHTGSGAELVGSLPLIANVQYTVLALVSSASANNGDSGVRTLVYGFRASRAGVTPMGLVDDDSGHVGDLSTTWTWAIASNQLQLSCAAAAGVVSRVAFLFSAFEQAVS